SGGRAGVGQGLAGDPGRAHQASDQQWILARPQRRTAVRHCDGPDCPANAQALSADLSEMSCAGIHSGRRPPAAQARLVAGLVGATVLSLPVRADIAVLLDRSLHTQTVNVLRIAQGKIVFTAVGGSDEKSTPLDGLLAMTEPGWWTGDFSPAAPAAATSD